MNVDRGPGHLRVGPVLVVWEWRARFVGPLVDGCSTTLHHDDGRREAFAGLILRLPRSGSVSVTVAGARVPNPARWRPRWILARIRWHLDGRPVARPSAPIVAFEDRRPG